MRKNVKLALIFNILIMTMEIVNLTSANTLNRLAELLYCDLANLLALVASFVMVLFILIKKEINETPFWVVALRYVASVSLILTTLGLFLVVIPMEQGLNGYFTNISLYIGEYSDLLSHILCPIMSAVSLIFFEGDRRLNKKKTMYYPCLFSLVYALVIVGMVVTNNIVAPYEFFQFVNKPIYISICVIVILAIGNYLIARYTLLFNQIKAPRIKLKR